MGQSQSKMDADWGCPDDYGNLHLWNDLWNVYDPIYDQLQHVITIYNW